jgi:UDP-glucose:(heptosyl)LPS alpha-1,3-glucosyltransferase
MRRFGARGAGLGAYHRAVLWLEAQQFRPERHRFVVAVSRRVGEEVQRGYGVAPERIRVLYNGVDLERFAPTRGAALRGETRRRLGIAPEAPVVVAVGSGFRRKGVDGLLEIWREEPPAGAHLVVVGGDERLAAYSRMTRNGALGGRVRFVGPQTAVEDFYAAADVAVVASLQEAFGNVVLEALACGLPVVTSEQVGAAELLGGTLRDLVIGRPDDVAALRERLVAALGPGRDERARLARQAAEAHPWSAHFAALERLLEETAACGRG